MFSLNLSRNAGRFNGVLGHTNRWIEMLLRVVDAGCQSTRLVGLLVPHIKKTAPLEQGFNVRRKATPKARPSVLSGLGECKAFVQ